LLRDAARLYKQAAAHGETYAAARLVQLLHWGEPSQLHERHGRNTSQSALGR
jgi:hypothetical protein